MLYFNVFIIAFLIYYLTYYLLLGISYLNIKRNKIYYFKKVNVTTISFSYILLTIVSLILIYVILSKVIDYNITYIFIWIFVLSIMMLITKLVPNKYYYVSNKGICMIDFHFRFINLYIPFKKWNKIKITSINNVGDYFYLEVIDKHFGLISISMHYEDFYAIKYFKNY